MKKLFLFIMIVVATNQIVISQIAVTYDGSLPDYSAMLDVKSNSSGLLVPRMTSSERLDILNPANSLLVFDTDYQSFWFYDEQNEQWQDLKSNNNNSLIADADRDTYIDVEPTADEDTVRIYIGGIEKFRFSGSTIETLNNGYSVFVGEYAGFNTTSELNRSVFVGAHAGYQNTTGDGNIAIGQGAFAFNTEGDFNTAIGMNALFLNVGEGNTALGESALVNSTTGVRNTAIGKHTMLTNVEGSYNTSLGYHSDMGSSDLTNSTAIGYGTIATASNQVRIGNANVSSIGGQVSWTTLSDARFKKDIDENVAGLDFILALRPVSYKIDQLAFNSFLGKEAEEEMKNIDRDITETGFIAQEVETVARELGFDFNGIDQPEDSQDYYGLRYGQFTVPLVKAVQEQQELIESLQSQILILEKEMNEIKN